MNVMMITGRGFVLLGVAYSAHRLANLFPLSLSWRWGIGIVWVCIILGLMLSMLLRSSLSERTTSWVYPLSSSVPFYLLYAVMIFIALDLLRLVPKFKPYLTASWDLVAWVWIVFFLIFAYAKMRYEHKVRVPLELKLDKPLSKPIKIVGISDMHLGYTIGKEELSQWVKLINDEKPDLILIAGDMVDGDVRPVLSEQMAEAFNQLKAPVYACLGNHEYIGGEADRQAFLRQTKVQLLRDSVAYLPEAGIYIVGRDDASNRYRQPLSALTASLDKSKPILLLDHQPHHLEEAEQSGIDFQLSGHTHRGQMFPINMIVDRMYEQSHGYLRKGRTQYYVSSGIGIWGGKYRIGSQSEYLVLTLR